MQLVASEASAGTKGGWSDCDDLTTRRRKDNVDASTHHAGTRTRKEGTGDLSSSDPEDGDVKRVASLKGKAKIDGTTPTTELFGVMD